MIQAICAICSELYVYYYDGRMYIALLQHRDQSDENVINFQY